MNSLESRIALCLLTIAAINVTAIVAPQGRVLVAVDVDDGCADGNGHEDKEPREAAYRPRPPRHPRDDGRTKLFIIIIIITAATAAVDLLSFPVRVDRSIARRPPHHHSREFFSLRRHSHCFLARSLRNRRYTFELTSSRRIPRDHLSPLPRLSKARPLSQRIDLKLCPSHEISLDILVK